jgi:hypothetical protein
LAAKAKAIVKTSRIDNPNSQNELSFIICTLSNRIIP